ncbi:NACHT domain-containing protein [Mycena leptocephala]|nr:NACHT domain-containing protein [Mycena leptocephala]
MLNGLYNWAIEDHDNCAESHDERESTARHSRLRPICWLHGPAGAGKSAIMQTLCQRLQDAGRLGGAFFFKRGHLAVHNQDLGPSISQIVEDNPSLVARHMEVQLLKLIVEPCQSVTNSSPLILLIDGLDECETQDSQAEILRLIGNFIRHHPKTFHFLIASRPEAHIRETFDEPFFYGILNSINVEKSFEDIRTYFRDQFRRIHREHRDTMGSVQMPWPSTDNLNMLVQKSSGYFVYASTVIKFIDDKYSRPTDRLVLVLSLTSTDSEAPFEALDQLYTHILSVVPIRFHSKLLDILQCVIVSRQRWNHLQIDQLLGLPHGDTQLILRALHSILKMGKTGCTAIYVHHASFLDFLQDPQRSLDFHIKLEIRTNVARALFKALSDSSHRNNSCNLTGHDLVKCIESIPPSAELVPLIHSFNPDFIWWDLDLTLPNKIDKVLTWLKAIRPVPEDLVHNWQSHQFMLLWNNLHSRLMLDSELRLLKSHLLSLSSRALHMLQTRMCNFSLVSPEDCRRFVARFLEFVRIFQASWLLSIYSSPSRSIYYTRLLLDLSWDQFVAAHSALCSIICGRTPKQVFAGATAIFAVILELCDIGTAISDLARGFLHLIRRVGTGDVSPKMCSLAISSHPWGQLVRCSPHSSPELLHDLHEFVPPWESFPSTYPHGFDCLCSAEFHDVVQWLKECPDPPLDLIERWQSYLTKSEEICIHHRPWDHPYEERWLKRVVVDLNETPLPLDEEEFVQAWEEALENATLG